VAFSSAADRLSQCSLHSRFKRAEKPRSVLLGQRRRSARTRSELSEVLATSRPTSALPIFACVHCLPVGEITRAPFLRQRDASGISEVTHTSTAEMCSAIQSSAASAASPTRTMRTFEVPGGLIGREPLETTGAPRRGRSPPAPGTHHHRRRCPSTLDPLSTELQTRVTRTRSDAMVDHLE